MSAQQTRNPASEHTRERKTLCLPNQHVFDTLSEVVGFSRSLSSSVQEFMTWSSDATEIYLLVSLFNIWPAPCVIVDDLRPSVVVGRRTPGPNTEVNCRATTKALPSAVVHLSLFEVLLRHRLVAPIEPWRCG